MVTNLDLTAPQTTRVLEQAVRLQATVELDVRTLGAQSRPIRGTIIARENALLRVRPEPNADLSDPLLIGAFADALLIMRGDRYEFCSCIIDIGAPSSPEMLIAIPQGVQIANRRRYVRKTPQEGRSVQLWLKGGDVALTCNLVDIAPTGLAVRGHRGDLDDILFVGDPLRVTIDIPAIGESFDLPVITCTKTLESDRQSLTVGLEFAPDASAQDMLALSRFRAFLNDPALGFSETESGK